MIRQNSSIVKQARCRNSRNLRYVRKFGRFDILLVKVSLAIGWWSRLGFYLENDKSLEFVNFNIA